MTFKAFADDASSMEIDELTLENQGERLSIYGSVQITQDKQGLAKAQQFAEVLQQAIAYLQTQDLPDVLATPAPAEEVDNPFWQDPKSDKP